MRQTSNLGLALYDSEDKMNITGAENSLNHNMELIDEAIHNIPKGDKGDAGDSATVEIGTVTTLPAGSQATVQNVGSKSSAVINFGIPKGDVGINGKSAYDYAYEWGYAGTETDFYSTLSELSTELNIERNQYRDVADLFRFETGESYGYLKQIHVPKGTKLVLKNVDLYDISIAFGTSSEPWNNFDNGYVFAESTIVDRIVLRRKDYQALTVDDTPSNALKILIPVNTEQLDYNNYAFVNGLFYICSVYWTSGVGYGKYNENLFKKRYILPLFFENDTTISFTPNASVSTYFYGSVSKACENVSAGEEYVHTFEKGEYLLYFWQDNEFYPDMSTLSLEYVSNEKKIITNYNDTYYANGRTIQAYNPYKNKGNIKSKGQLHCHTTNSDGDYSPSQVCSDYKTEGYDFITITDHNYVTKEPSDNELIWLFDSYEDTRNTAGNQHMNIYNADAPINKVSIVDNTNTPNILVENFVKHGESLLQYNHPEDPVVYATDDALKHLPKGISFIEVYNGSEYHTLGEFDTLADFPTENVRWNDRYLCKEDGLYYANRSKTSTPDWQARSLTDYPDETPERAICILLDNGHKVFATATDDYHSKAQFNRGWIVAFSKSKTRNSILNAIANGCFYASSGVVLNDISVEDGVYNIEIENGDDCKTTFYGEGNSVLKEMEGSTPFYEMTGNEKYIRATISRPDGVTSAWTQPVWNLNKTYQFDLAIN